MNQMHIGDNGSRDLFYVKQKDVHVEILYVRITF